MKFSNFVHYFLLYVVLKVLLSRFNRLSFSCPSLLLLSLKISCIYMSYHREELASTRVMSHTRPLQGGAVMCSWCCARGFRWEGVSLKTNRTRWRAVAVWCWRGVPRPPNGVLMFRDIHRHLIFFTILVKLKMCLTSTNPIAVIFSNEWSTREESILLIAPSWQSLSSLYYRNCHVKLV